MNAEIITIGDEILIGQIVDTNSAFLGKTLNKIGISIYQISSVQDDKTQILEALKAAEQRADIVIITGGLGPTKDDITKHALCEYFDDQLISNQTVLDHIEYLFKNHINTPISDLNRNQALLPSKSTILMNQYGTAPGMWFEKGKTVFISLPGVPFEMKTLIKNEVIPKLIKTFKFPSIYHKTLITYGLGESAIAKRIEDWESQLPDFVKLAYLPSFGRVRIRISGKHIQKSILVKTIDDLAESLKPFIKDIFLDFETDQPIEATIGEAMSKQGKTLATAESITGGSIAKIFTNNPGASRYFKGAIVAYDTKIKQTVLQVKKETIQQFSVVSQEVAEEMAVNARQIFKSDYAISTTGNAGPSKGDSDAAIGTVAIALATKDGVQSQVYNFGNHRERVVQKSINKAVEILQKEIFKK